MRKSCNVETYFRHQRDILRELNIMFQDSGPFILMKAVTDTPLDLMDQILILTKINSGVFYSHLFCNGCVWKKCFCASCDPATPTVTTPKPSHSPALFLERSSSKNLFSIETIFRALRVLDRQVESSAKTVRKHHVYG